MNKTLLLFAISLHILVLISSKEEKISLNIERARAHSDQTGNLTPLVVSLTSQDTKIKTKPVDLICIVDVSGSMWGDKIKLVIESLKYLVNLMNEEDNFALVKFNECATVVNNFTKMTEENKTLLMKYIDGLNGFGGTNILDGLKKALDLIADDYSSGERIASLILLSDGIDNYYNNINDHLLYNLENNRPHSHIYNYLDHHLIKSKKQSFLQKSNHLLLNLRLFPNHLKCLCSQKLLNYLYFSIIMSYFLRSF